MAAKYLRRRTWWVRFYDPRTGKLMRGSLETPDAARAELLRQHIEIEAALLDPRFQAARIPAGIRQLMRGGCREQRAGEPAAPVIVSAVPPPLPSARTRVNIGVALKAYLDFIRIENSAHHVAGKLSMMRRFFGSEPVNAMAGKRATSFDVGVAAFFEGGFVDEITPALVQRFMDQLEVSKKTKRHYREFFHHFFQFCMKFEFYQPTNWHSPNPIAALPSYASRNRRIVFLTHEQVEEQLRLFTECPRLQIAVAIMIYVSEASRTPAGHSVATAIRSGAPDVAKAADC